MGRFVLASDAAEQVQAMPGVKDHAAQVGGDGG